MKKITNRKFVNSVKVDWSYDDLIKGIELPKKLPKDLNQYDQAYFFTEDKRIVQGFLYLHENKPVIIPEPEPSILYFINAERVLNDILCIRKEIFSSLGLENANKIDLLFSDFFIISFNYIINLFAAIEAFNNSTIPEEFTYRDKKRLLDREKIQRFTKFDLKVEKIIPQIFNKSFIESFNEKYILICELKSIRDNLIHTKNHSKNWAASYRDIYRKLLQFDFKNAYNFTKDYMNYYKEGWIEEVEINTKHNT